MFRNLAMAMVSVWAVSTGSPAWSQNSPVEAKPPPLSDDQQYGQSDSQSRFEEARGNCYNKQAMIKGQLYCKGEEARLLFKILKEFNTDTTVVHGTRWFQRVFLNTSCWAREESDGKDFIVSMSYACTVHNY